MELSLTPYALEVASVSDTGTERDHNEDFCAHFLDGTGAVVAVADGVSGHEGGDTASRTAVETIVREYRDQPAALGPAKRLYRSVQQANIDVYDLALVVPELRGMSTTLTTMVLDQGDLHTVHIGDTRLYLVRDGAITQLTKDHTSVAEKVRLGLLSAEKARTHPDKSILTRSLGRELIPQVDRITTPLLQGDVLIVCSDGLHNVLSDEELTRGATGPPAADACRALVDKANARGTADNLTVALVRLLGPVPDRPKRGLGAALRRLVGGAPG